MTTLLENDGLYMPEIGPHSVEKIRRHNYYAAVFSKAMKNKWPQRAYVGLYSGAGMARMRGSGELIETSALAVLKQEVPFTKYIFVDSDPRCIEALQARSERLGRDLNVTYICNEVNESVEEVLTAMPSYSRDHGLLSLCFVDPFRADLDFSVIHRLSRYRMDFLVLLPLGFDLRRNLKKYLTDSSDHRVAKLIDDPEWREEWRASAQPDRRFVTFLLRKFDDAMARLGYRRREMRDTVNVKVSGMGVFLYALALYSKHERGQDFWRTTVASTSPQLPLGF